MGRGAVLASSRLAPGAELPRGHTLRPALLATTAAAALQAPRHGRQPAPAPCAGALHPPLFGGRPRLHGGEGRGGCVHKGGAQSPARTSLPVVCLQQSAACVPPGCPELAAAGVAHARPCGRAPAPCWGGDHSQQAGADPPAVPMWPLPGRWRRPSSRGPRRRAPATTSSPRGELAHEQLQQLALASTAGLGSCTAGCGRGCRIPWPAACAAAGDNPPETRPADCAAAATHAPLPSPLCRGSMSQAAGGLLVRAAAEPAAVQADADGGRVRPVLPGELLLLPQLFQAAAGHALAVHWLLGLGRRCSFPGEGVRSPLLSTINGAGCTASLLPNPCCVTHHSHTADRALLP